MESLYGFAALSWVTSSPFSPSAVLCRNIGPFPPTIVSKWNLPPKTKPPLTETPTAQCSSYQYYQIVNAVFNISTDILILAVGVPPVLKARLSLQQKLILGIIFGMGTFVIVAAILRAIYCLVPSLISYVYMNWYFREASVSIYVTVLPGIWVFLREMFPILQKFTSRKGTKVSSSRGGDHQQTPWRQPHNKNRSHLESKELDFDLDTYPISKSIAAATESELGERGNVSGEHGHGDSDSTGSGRYEAGMHEIRRDVTFTVERVPMTRP